MMLTIGKFRLMLLCPLAHSGYGNMPALGIQYAALELRSRAAYWIPRAGIFPNIYRSGHFSYGHHISCAAPPGCH